MNGNFAVSGDADGGVLPLRHPWGARSWHDYMDYYMPDYKLFPPVSNMKNENTKASLEETKRKISLGARRAALARAAKLRANRKAELERAQLGVAVQRPC